MAFIVADRVKETSLSTGTGTFALAGAMTGFSTFASRCAVGDTLYYAIQGVDGGGSPSGEWECGLGTYSAANTLTRTTVTASSNSDAAVSFSAGDKQVFITMPAAQVKWARERLTAARTYYVRTDGSDSNTGLANSAGGAFLTIQKAVDTVCLGLDMGSNQVTIQVGDGTYTAANTLKPYVGSVAPIITGNVATPANVLVSTTSASCFSLTVAYTWAIKGMKLVTTTSGYGLTASRSGVINFQNIDFGASAGHIAVASWGVVGATGSYTISGGAPFHFVITDGGVVAINSVPVTITGTPAFATSFCYLRTLGVLSAVAATFSGSATGSRYNVSLNSVVFVNGAGTSFLPGNAAGITATGGQYA